MKSSLYRYLLREVEKKINDQDPNYEEKIKKQNRLAKIREILECCGIFFVSLSFIIFLYEINGKQTANAKLMLGDIIGFAVGLVLEFLAALFAVPQSKISKIELDKDKLFKSMISDKNLYNRLNQVLEESPDKNLAMNILISDSKYEHKESKYKFLFKMALNVLMGCFSIRWILKNLDFFIVSICIIICVVMIVYIIYIDYKKFYINILDLKKGTLELYIKDYVTGYITCKWDIRKEGDNVVLKIHSGLFDPGQLTSNINNSAINNSDEINKIVIDPGVVAPKDSAQLFENFSNVKEFVGLSNLDTSQVTNMHEMFVSCGAKELDLSGWDTSKVTDMGSMFLKCLNLEKVNVKGWDTTNVKDMSSMFFDCPKLHKLDLSNFKTPNLKMGEMMFGEDSIYDLDIRNLESSKKGTHMLFERSLIYKITVGPKFTDTFPDFNPINRTFEEDGIMYIPTSNKWVALDGTDKDSKKDPHEMQNVTRTQPVTYEVEHMPLENKNNHSYNQHTLLWRMVKRLLGLI